MDGPTLPSYGSLHSHFVDGPVSQHVLAPFSASEQGGRDERLAVEARRGPCAARSPSYQGALARSLKPERCRGRAQMHYKQGYDKS